MTDDPVAPAVILPSPPVILPKAGSPALTHADESGHVRMVDVSAKLDTARRATATGRVRMSTLASDLLRTGSLPKGDGLAVARVAGIAAVKRTPDLIPLCHPIAVDGAEVDLDVGEGFVDITVSVNSVGRTGAEMEALTGVSAAALTIIDMIKAVDKSFAIEDIHVVSKSGGTSGDWSAPDDLAAPTCHPDPTCHPALCRTAGSLPPMGYVIVSDRRSAGQAEDTTGPIIARTLEAAGASRLESRLVPDDEPAIVSAVEELIADGCRIVVTSGGTGVGPRDRTPEALAPIIGQCLPGVAEALRSTGGAKTAVLSRQVAGIVRPKNGTGGPALIVALPGSVRAVEESMAVLVPLFSHVISQLDGEDHG